MADEEKTLGILIEVLNKDVAALEQLNTQMGQLTVAQTRHTAAVKEHTISERDLSREAAISARAMGQLGAAGGEAVERFTNLTTAAGGLQGTLLGVGVLGLGAVVEGTKSAIEQSERHERAVKDLEQAYEASGIFLDLYRGKIQNFLDTNRRFITDQEQAREGFAMMTRAGLDQNMVFEAMNVSLDLAALKHITLEDAERRVLLGLEGNARGLKELGIQLKTIQGEDDNTAKAAKNLEEATKKVEEATKAHEIAARRLLEMETALKDKGHKPTHEELLKLEDAQKKAKDSSDELTAAQAKQKEAHEATTHAVDTQNKTLAELKDKTDQGRKSTTDLEQSTNDLRRSWQDLSDQAGPVMAKSLSEDIDWLLAAANATDRAAQAAWGLVDALKAAAAGGQVQAASGGYTVNYRQGGPRQAGGPVFAGGIYTVGESGPETLVIGAGAGMVIPGAGGGGGGGDTTIYTEVIMDGEVIARAVDRRVSRILTST